jgi:hypothetical protein
MKLGEQFESVSVPKRFFHPTFQVISDPRVRIRINIWIRAKKTFVLLRNFNIYLLANWLIL